MNKRDYKQFMVGNFYHIYNRGTAKMNIFLDDEDYMFFLRRLAENLFPEREEFALMMPMHPDGRASSARGRNKPYVRGKLPKDSFSIFAYVLMPNHFHIFILQNSEISVSKLLLKVATSYSKYFNKKYTRVGGLFQDQFKAVLVERDNQARWLIEYIHQNPVRAGLVKQPEHYKWSSIHEYHGGLTPLRTL